MIQLMGITIINTLIMKETDMQLIKDLLIAKLTYAEVLNDFSVDIRNDSGFVREEINKAIQSNDAKEIEMALQLVWLSSSVPLYTDILNELLVNPHHRKHQEIARTLQDYPNVSTIPFVRRVLESNFDFLKYTCSDSGAITKWFSWLLYSIGTPEAINLMKEFSHSSNRGIREEMLYRLAKMK